MARRRSRVKAEILYATEKMKLLVSILLIFTGSCYASEELRVKRSAFSLPSYFQVNQVIENITWQGRSMRIQFIQSAVGMVQLTLNLAEDIPQGALLTKGKDSLQFNWMEGNTSHVIELKEVSEQLVEGMYSSIQANQIDKADIGRRPSHFERNESSFFELLPADITKLFEFQDRSDERQSVEIAAYRSRLPSAQLAQFITGKLAFNHWVIMKRYAATSYQDVWDSIEAMHGPQRLNIYIHPDPKRAGVLFLRSN